jgi:hypothetical protein
MPPAEAVKIFGFYTPIPRGCRNFIHFLWSSLTLPAQTGGAHRSDGTLDITMVLLKVRAGFFEWGWQGAVTYEAVSCGA